MTDWREIPVQRIDWRALHRSMGRTINPLRRLCTPPLDGRRPERTEA